MYSILSLEYNGFDILCTIPSLPRSERASCFLLHCYNLDARLDRRPEILLSGLSSFCLSIVYGISLGRLLLCCIGNTTSIHSVVQGVCVRVYVCMYACKRAAAAAAAFV